MFVFISPSPFNWLHIPTAVHTFQQQFELPLFCLSSLYASKAVDFLSGGRFTCFEEDSVNSKLLYNTVAVHNTVAVRAGGGGILLWDFQRICSLEENVDIQARKHFPLPKQPNDSNMFCHAFPQEAPVVCRFPRFGLAPQSPRCLPPHRAQWGTTSKCLVAAAAGPGPLRSRPQLRSVLSAGLCPLLFFLLSCSGNSVLVRKKGGRRGINACGCNLCLTSALLAFCKKTTLWKIKERCKQSHCV